MIDRETQDAVFYALFHWFECEHGDCGHMNEAMERLASSSAGLAFRQYRDRLGDPFTAPPPLGAAAQTSEPSQIDLEDYLNSYPDRTALLSKQESDVRQQAQEEG